MERAPDFEGEPRLLGASEWRQQRWGWMESLSRDGSINSTARLVGHVLALQYVNVDSMRCDPKLSDLSVSIAASTDTVSRAIKDLVGAGWIVTLAGRGRGNQSRYGFLTRAKIVTLKGGKYADRKGGKYADRKGGKIAGFSGAQKGADMRLKGGNYAGPYIKDKPCNNHKGAGEAKKPSENPMVIAEAQRLVAAFRDGRSDAFGDAPAWIINHIIAAQLLTDQELQAAGLC